MTDSTPSAPDAPVAAKPAPDAAPTPSVTDTPVPKPAPPAAAQSAVAKTPNAAPAAPAAAPKPEAQKAAVAAAPAKPAPPVRAPAVPATRKMRHWGLLFSFIIIVLGPVAASSWYLYTKAVDQFASTLAFTVRSEDITSAADILGGLGTSLGGGGSADADILYEFIRSQEMVQMMDAQLDLRGLYSTHHDTDPVLSFDPSGTIEDLTAYWRRMVRVSYDGGSGMMELRVLAFDPQEAKLIAEAIYGQSSAMINNLSAIAREDGTRYAREDLDFSVERLKSAREALTAFRVKTQIVDPTADVQGQMGLLNTLQAQQAEALIELDLLANATRDGDPRLEQAQRRIEVIEARIVSERRKFGVGAPGDESYATTIAEFERLAVDREFAEQAYAVALSAYDAARAEANRQSRYLAAYISPTLAERAEFPQRALFVGIVGLFSFLIWSILSLVYYSLRDRR